MYPLSKDKVIIKSQIEVQWHKVKTNGTVQIIYASIIWPSEAVYPTS